MSWSRKPDAPQAREASFRNAGCFRVTLVESRLYLENKSTVVSGPLEGSSRGDAWCQFVMPDFLENGLGHK